MEAAHCFTSAVMAQLTGKCCPQRPSFVSLNRGKKEDAKSGWSVVCVRTVSWFLFLLLVFHIITSCTARVPKELILQFCGLTTFQILASQKRRRTTYPKGPDGWRRKIRDGSHGIWLFRLSLSGSQAEGWVCFQVVRLHSRRSFGFGNSLSLIWFDLIHLISIWF